MPPSSERMFRVKTVDGFTREPLTEPQLIQLIRTGKLGAEDQVQRIGSDRWRALGQLAPHIFSERAASEGPASQPPEPRVGDWMSQVNEMIDSAGPAVPRQMEEPQYSVAESRSEPSAPESFSDEASRRARGPAPRTAGALAGAQIVGWIFVGLTALELLAWANRTFGAMAGARQLGRSAAPATLLPFTPAMLMELGLAGITAFAALLSHPLLALSVIPGAIFCQKLVSALPISEQPTSVGQVWFRWSLWIAIPIAAYIGIRIMATSGTSMLMPFIIAAATLATLVLFGLLILSLNRAVANRLEDAGIEPLKPFGLIGAWLLISAVSLRALMMAYLGYGLEMATNGADVIGLQGDQVEMIVKLSTYLQIASLALITAWVGEISLRLPSIAPAFPERRGPSRRRG